MATPFPGMDPYLEHPALWPDVHNRLVAALGDVLTPLVAPRYYVALESRTYLMSADDLEIVFAGRPDASVVRTDPTPPKDRPSARESRADRATVLEVDVPMLDEVSETYLEVRETHSHEVVTVIEVLSPANKVHTRGRQDYEQKRLRTFATMTNLIEIDLLRAGAPLPVIGDVPDTDYRLLVSRGRGRPRAEVLVFGVRQAIPSFSLPLRSGDTEPEVDLGQIVHAVYERGRFDLRIDYSLSAEPPLHDEDARWARELVA